jgi:hypothetical protein
VRILKAIKRSPSRGIEELNTLYQMMERLTDRFGYLIKKNKDIIFISDHKVVESREIEINKLEREAVAFAIDLIKEVNGDDRRTE